MEIGEILFDIETDNSSDIDSEVKSDSALESRVSLHDVVFARHKREEIEIDKSGNLGQEIACQANFLFQNRVKNCKQSIDCE